MLRTPPFSGKPFILKEFFFVKYGTEDWEFLLVDAKNAFNKINKTGMPWTVCNLCPSRARFVFNCYSHWSSLVLRNGNGKASFLHSREGATQWVQSVKDYLRYGYPPTYKTPEWDITDITQPWYADNAGALGTFAIIETYLNLLMRQVPGTGYNTKPSKSILIVHPRDIKAGK